MKLERTRDSSQLRYLTVLLGAAVFLVTLFLPFAREGSESRSILASWSASPIPGRLAGYLYLFGGITVVAIVAIAGLTQERARRWTRDAIAIVATAWSFPWLGRIVNFRGTSFHLEVGYWLLIASLLLIISGSAGVTVTDRRRGSRNEVTDPLTPGPRSRYGYVVVLVAMGAFLASLALPIVRFGAGPSSVSVSAMSLWEIDRHIGGILTFLGGLVTIAATAILGIRARAAAPWIAYALVGAVAVWSFFWAAFLLSLLPGFSVGIGFWALTLSVGLTAWGALEAFLTARDAPECHAENAA